MQASFTPPRLIQSMCAGLLVAILLLAPRGVAAAQSASVAVLTFSGDDVSEALIREVSEAVRKAVPAQGAYTLVEAKASLDQLSMAQDCDAAEAGCLASIASGLKADGIIYGSLARKSPSGVTVDAHFFDARDSAAMAHASADLTTSDPQSAEVQPAAKTLVEQLFGASAPVAAVPPPVAASAPVVASEPEPSAPPPAVAVGDGDRASDNNGGKGMSGRALAGYTLLGVAAVSVGMTAFSFVQIDRAEGNVAFDAYRRAVGKLNPSASDVCDEADTGLRYGLDARTFAAAQDKCSAGHTFEVLQFVFLGAAVVSGGFSAYFLLSDDDAPSDHARVGGATLALRPTVSRKSAGLSARLRF